MATTALNLLGKTFGWLTVLKKTGSHPTRGVMWLVRCRCGKETEKSSSELTKKNRRSHQGPRSCGCAPTGRVYTSKHGQAGELGGYRYSMIRTAAVHRGFVFDVTIEYLWELFLAQDRKCSLSGLPLYLSSRHSNEGEERASLDRIDSDKGYIPGNIQWVHPTLNFMKHAMPQARFIELCALVTKHQDR